MVLVPLFDLKFLNELAVVEELQIGGTRAFSGKSLPRT
jgi:hypothetical protein